MGKSWQVTFSADQMGSLFATAGATSQQLPLIQEAQFGQKTMLIASHLVGNVTVVELEHCQPEPHKFNFTDRVGFPERLAQERGKCFL